MTLESWYPDCPFCHQGVWCGGSAPPTFHISWCCRGLRCVRPRLLPLPVMHSRRGCVYFVNKYGCFWDPLACDSRVGLEWAEVRMALTIGPKAVFDLTDL